MFKKVFFVLLGLVLAYYFINHNPFNFKSANESTVRPTFIPTIVKTQPQKNQEIIKKSIFVPYWSLDQTTNFDQYDRLFYFGITVNSLGVNKKEPGYLNLNQFTLRSGQKEKYLTLRMTDPDTNFTILADANLQDNIINETISLATENNFQGVVLDLEVSSLFNNKIPAQINTFVEKLYEQSKNQNLKLSLALFGDLVYRKRPYDLATLAKNSDEVIIMAYDLHKSQGEPGPNFPLGGRETYGYDFASMIGDFLGQVPSDKLTVAYGMYGYDWIVDEKKRPIKPARSLPLTQIRKDFLGKCEWKNCTIFRDDISAETEIDYIDRSGNLHVLWFEDEKSTQEKNNYFLKNGINSSSYWAYGYF